ncbi:MAG: signal peptidase I [Neomegalonema sp.]|nr:signal peptidase I [Neomegalonema sp.]
MKADNSTAAEDQAAEEHAGDSLGEIIRTVVYALLIALVFRTLLFQPFSIPSGSMKSTLLVGDYLFVSKYSYGYSKYSLPWGSRVPSWLMSGRIVSSDPKRGDVIVFRNPRDKKEDYIKRLVGLPGDRIKVVDGLLYINGDPVKLQKVAPFVESVKAGAGRLLCNESRAEQVRTDKCSKTRYMETLPGGVKHAILDVDGLLTTADNKPDASSVTVKAGEFVVPKDHYFFMGDNRDNSVDSRFEGSSGIGMVNRELLIGRAEFILLSSDGAFWEFWNWRGDRFFKSIR